MATKKKVAPTAPSQKPTVGKTPVVRKDGKPTRAEKSAKNKAMYKQILAEETAALREVMPPANPTVIHPEGSRKPTEYTDELGMQVCMKFATDPSMSVLKLNSDPTMPTIWHFYQWLIDYPHLDKAYSRAREIQSDLQAAELEEWSTNTLIGTKTIRRTKQGPNGDEVSEEVQEYDNIERARLRVQTRQWLLSKYRPKKYGVQPLQIETTGEDALSELLQSFRERNRSIEDA